MHLNKTNFHMKDFALSLSLKQRQKATRRSPIDVLARDNTCQVAFGLLRGIAISSPEVSMKFIPVFGNSVCY